MESHNIRRRWATVHFEDVKPTTKGNLLTNKTNIYCKYRFYFMFWLFWKLWQGMFCLILVALFLLDICYISNSALYNLLIRLGSNYAHISDNHNSAMKIIWFTQFVITKIWKIVETLHYKNIFVWKPNVQLEKKLPYWFNGKCPHTTVLLWQKFVE